MHVRITGARGCRSLRGRVLRVCLLIQSYRDMARARDAENFPLLEFESGCIESNNELSTDNAKGDFSISLCRASCFSRSNNLFKTPDRDYIWWTLVRRLRACGNAFARGENKNNIRSICAPRPTCSASSGSVFSWRLGILIWYASDIFAR